MIFFLSVLHKNKDRRDTTKYAYLNGIEQNDLYNEFLSKSYIDTSCNGMVHRKRHEFADACSEIIMLSMFKTNLMKERICKCITVNNKAKN